MADQENILEQQPGEDEKEERPSSPGGNNRYTEVENDYLLNPIEGFNPNEPKPEEEVKEPPENSKEKKKDKKKKDKKNVDPNEHKKFEFKLIVLGDFEVGKTSLINRYVDNTFNKFSGSTIGGEIKKKKIEIDDKTTAILTICDTAGEEKMGKLMKNYYTDIHGALIMFDLTNEKSFNDIKFWLTELENNAPKDVVYGILGNKSDITFERKVELEEIKKLTGDGDILFYEVSAKTGINVSLAFEQLIFCIMDKQKDEEKNPDKVVRGKEGRHTTDLRDVNEKEIMGKKCGC